MSSDDLRADLEARTQRSRFDELAPFRETCLLEITDPGANGILRRFGRLIAVMASEMERFWPVRKERMPRPQLRAAARDIRFLESFLAVQGLMHLTEPELTSGQIHASQVAAAEAVKLGEIAVRLEEVVSSPPMRDRCPPSRRDRIRPAGLD